MQKRFLQLAHRADPRGHGQTFNARVWLLLSFAAAATLLLAQSFQDEDLLEHTVVNAPLDQIGHYADDAAEPLTVKWSRAAMHNPILAFQLRQNLKTQEQKDAEAEAILAITDPDAYRQRQEAAERRPTTPAEQAAESQAARDRAEALRVILNPIEAAREKERLKTTAIRRREAIAEQAILHPHEFNQVVAKHKSPELLQKEAEALLALSDPEKFLVERQQFKKTGSKTPIKEPLHAVGAAEDTPSPSVPRPNHPEKGTKGGRQ